MALQCRPSWEAAIDTPASQETPCAVEATGQDDSAEVFEVQRRGSMQLWVRRAHSKELLAADLWSLERFFEQPEGSYHGRGRAAVARLESGRRVVIRAYRHGGLLRFLTGDCFLGPTRLAEELAILDLLERSGLAVPRGLAGRARRRWFGLWQLHLITGEIPDARDLRDEMTATPHRRGSGWSRWRRTVAELGEIVGGVHARDVHHSDLHVKNLMVDQSGRAWIIDFDKASRGLTEARRLLSLAKLYRSGTKLPEPARPSLAELARFARGYFGPDWRDGWRRVQKQYQRWLPLHRLGWWLEGWFSSS